MSTYILQKKSGFQPQMRGFEQQGNEGNKEALDVDKRAFLTAKEADF